MSKKDLEELFKKHNLNKNLNKKLSNQKVMNILGDFLKLHIKDIDEARKKAREDYPGFLKEIKDE